jgi:hypothetical protein
MIPNRMSTSRWSLAAIIAAWTLITVAPAQAPSANSIDGVYDGSYAGDQGPTKFKLTLTFQSNGTLAGVFTFYPPGSSGTTSYTCDIVGRYLQASRLFQLRRCKWETVAPTNLVMMGMNGTFDPNGGQGAGQILGKMLGRPGPDFEAIRNAAESAELASVTAATKYSLRQCSCLRPTPASFSTSLVVAKKGRPGPTNQPA